MSTDVTEDIGIDFILTILSYIFLIMKIKIKIISKGYPRSGFAKTIAHKH